MRWIGLGCGVAHSEFVGWLAMVRGGSSGGFWSIPMLLGCGFFICFYVRPNTVNNFFGT